MDELLIPRPLYFDQLVALIDVPMVKVLTGVRRCGKSTLLAQLANRIRETKDGSVVVELNLESIDGVRIRTAEQLIDFVNASAPSRTERTYFFFDEIQQVAGWEDVINALRVSWNCDIYVTGSNSRMLSGDLATHLAGRYTQIPVRPLVFSEFVRLYEHLGLGVDDLFAKFVRYGGYPMLKFYNFNEDLVTQYLRDVFDSAVRRDVIEHHEIRDVDMFDRVMAFVFDNIGSPFSARSLAAFVKSEGRKVSVEKILAYLGYLEEAFLVEKMPRWDVNGKELLRLGEKWFVADLGLRTVLGFRNEESIERSLENIVYQELRARGYEVRVGAMGSKEIDFVATRAGEVEYYQVSYLLASEATAEREFGVFAEVADNYPKFVLTMDPLDLSRKGIRHRNIREWLLGGQ
ncbi:putative AAA+ superfamily ATPase [Arcanobacterium wilhelmae]|uniref:AAA+ superfamily ATPase n=1 Tax=Arcanobacterium wilhelmae TaxID=1803177 RepID=A0ABT9NA91_9ACTO|nr:ATP-binding protein [Arcanobacterium wilhelmae]MDP9800608.1 putative AAA+ superfamily ATPase [Arcanobacterium wilhelmae]WFN90016.1 ATP-binding protein [Arcanobacterium wilhelmae]